jgi:hypothetical protein
MLWRQGMSQEKATLPCKQYLRRSVLVQQVSSPALQKFPNHERLQKLNVTNCKYAVMKLQMLFARKTMQNVYNYCGLLPRR